MYFFLFLWWGKITGRCDKNSRSRRERKGFMQERTGLAKKIEKNGFDPPYSYKRQGKLFWTKLKHLGQNA